MGAPGGGELQQLFVDSTTGVVLLTERAAGRVLGQVTLHDLFRAEALIAERGESPAV